jgi:hypothetical protein
MIEPSSAAQPVGRTRTLATPPKRGTGTIIGGIVGLVVLIAAGVTGCSSGGSNQTAAPATTQPPTTAAPPTTAPAYSGSLQDLVVPKPASATLTPNERKGAADGSLTAKDVASEYAGSEAAVSGILTQTDFQRGVFIAWRDNGTLVYIQIYQFKADAGAASWQATQERSIKDVATSTAAFDEIPGGHWFVTRTPDGRGGAHAFYSKGPLVVMIDTFRTGAADLDGTKKMAVDQYHRLP